MNRIKERMLKNANMDVVTLQNASQNLIRTFEEYNSIGEKDAEQVEYTIETITENLNRINGICEKFLNNISK